MDSNLPPGCRPSDFEEDTSTMRYRYVNEYGNKEQYQLCAEYLDAVHGWERYHEAHDEDGIGVRAYVEKLDSFWTWLDTFGEN